MTALKKCLGETNKNLKIIKDLGYKLPNKFCKYKQHCIIIQCSKCNSKFKSTYVNFKSLAGTRCEEKHISRNIKRCTKEWTRIRHIYRKMMDRCYNKDNKSYERYGEKGVIVYKAWHDKKKFYNWSIKNGYANNLTIDRIDNNKGYHPKNCRWITLKEQARNKRCTISIEKVKEIKSLLRKELTCSQIANIVQTTIHRVNDISSGKTWADI